MKKVYIFFVVMLSMSVLFSCGGSNDSKKTFDKNTDVIGEADSLSPHAGRASESFAKATLNGREIEFKFMDNMLTAGNTFTLTESADGNYSSFMFELGSDAQLREKIALQIINYNLSKATIPFIFPTGKQEGKQIKLDLAIQKSSIFINYNNDSNFACSITAMSADTIEGNFFGEVKNAAGRAIKIENGVFKVKITKAEMKVQ